MNDYTLSIVCDHTRQPGEHDYPARVVARLAHYPRPVDTDARHTFGWLEWRELSTGDPRQPPALQTYFGEARRLGRAPTTHAMDELVPGMSEGQRWRFYCLDCDDTEPMRHARLVDRLEELRHREEPFVLLSQLAPSGV